MSEHDEQVALVSWFKTQYPKYKDCIIAIPNGAHLAGSPKQRARKIAKMKKEGLKNGVSDLFIAVPVGNKSGLWIEMKDTNKTRCSVSESQMAHLELMREVGYEAVWCAGFENARTAIYAYFGSDNV
ncbi:VRR-NUC domain-containing protein [Candidatus Pacearchaeota archaeon]|nr:VRR-NUC domain-containing protein [Candidatus Pacearchaeota archaeon]